MSGEVIFYRLNAKVLERAEDVPPESKQVVYYSLAIGHHIGVFDCFKPVLRCGVDAFQGFVGKLSGEARRKFEGLDRFGEIIVDRSHTRLLSQAVAEVRSDLDDEMRGWADSFGEALAAIEREPAIYLMGRKT